MANNDRATTLDALLNPSKENQQRLREKIQKLRKLPEAKNLVTTKALHDGLNLHKKVTKASFNHFLVGRTDLPDGAYKDVVRHMYEQKLFTELWFKEGLATEPDALFHALSIFLDVGVQTLENLTAEAPGIYRVWRPSMHVPGRYIRGRLDVNPCAETAALRIRETHVFKAEPGVAPQREEFEGFIVKKSRAYIIIARQVGYHGGPPRITMVHNVVFQGEFIQAMEGVVTGSYGLNALFTAPVYFERVPAAELAALDDELDIIPAAELPASIAPKLRLEVTENMIRF